MAEHEFDEVPATKGGKRLGITWASWMGDWFVSWSPRNDNSNAEGPWDQWVDLAIKILRDPMTEKVRPEARELALRLQTYDFYDEARVHLDGADLAKRFGRAEERSDDKSDLGEETP